MPETVEQGSPEWWRDRLLDALTAQARRVDRFETYYDGEHPIPKPPKALDSDVYRRACEQYRELARMGLTNFTGMIADVPADRLAVEGFTFDDGPDAEGSRSDRAWDIWQRSHLDADQGMAHATALSTGQAYALVSRLDDGRAAVTLEHPAQTIVAYRPGSRRDRVAALKCWRDAGTEVVVLYLPDGVHRWVRDASSRPVSGYSVNLSGPGGWERDGEPFENEQRVIPIVEFRANPRLRPTPFGGGRSEYQTVLPIQDRINKTVFDRLVTAEFQAFRQRYVIGWQPPENPETGQPDPVATYRASVARLQIFNNDDPEALNNIRAGEYAQADFTGFLSSVEADIQQMAAITRTPAYYLLGQMVNISSDALIAAEAGLVAKTLKHADNFGETWEEVMRLALMAEGDTDAADAQVTTLWRDVEQRTWGQTVDAATKMRDLEVPREALWLMLPGATPQSVRQWRSMRAMEALLTAPPAPAPTQPSAVATAAPEAV